MWLPHAIYKHAYICTYVYVHIPALVWYTGRKTFYKNLSETLGYYEWRTWERFLRNGQLTLHVVSCIKAYVQVSPFHSPAINHTHTPNYIIIRFQRVDEIQNTLITV